MNAIQILSPIGSIPEAVGIKAKPVRCCESGTVFRELFARIGAFHLMFALDLPFPATFL